MQDERKGKHIKYPQKRESLNIARDRECERNFYVAKKPIEPIRVRGGKIANSLEGSRSR